MRIFPLILITKLGSEEENENQGSEVTESALLKE
jgi:hypothetical protein